MSIIEQAVLNALERGSSEDYELPAHRRDPLAAAVQRAAVGPDAVAEMQRLLELTSALAGELNSLTAAEAIREMIRDCPEALNVVRTHILRDDAADEVRSFLEREGRAVPLKAPKVDDQTNGEQTKLRDFLNPGSERRPR